MHSNTLSPLTFPRLDAIGRRTSNGIGATRFSTTDLLRLQCQGACVAQFMMTQSKGGLFSPQAKKFADFFEMSIDKISLVSDDDPEVSVVNMAIFEISL